MKAELEELARAKGLDHIELSDVKRTMYAWRKGDELMMRWKDHNGDGWHTSITVGDEFEALGKTRCLIRIEDPSPPEINWKAGDRHPFRGMFKFDTASRTAIMPVPDFGIAWALIKNGRADPDEDPIIPLGRLNAMWQQ